MLDFTVKESDDLHFALVGITLGAYEAILDAVPSAPRLFRRIEGYWSDAVYTGEFEISGLYDELSFACAHVDAEYKPVVRALMGVCLIALYVRRPVEVVCD